MFYYPCWEEQPCSVGLVNEENGLSIFNSNFLLEAEPTEIYKHKTLSLTSLLGHFPSFLCTFSLQEQTIKMNSSVGLRHPNTPAVHTPKAFK